MNAWRAERSLGDTGEQARMSPELLAELDGKNSSEDDLETGTRRAGAALWATRIAVSLVAGVAAVVSYWHMYELAHGAGEQWRAWLLPLSVDGLIVASSMTLLVARRADRPAGKLAWCAMWIGVFVSLAANIAAAAPSATGRLVAAWPPLALLMAYELLMKHVGRATGPQEEGTR